MKSKERLLFSFSYWLNMVHACWGFPFCRKSLWRPSTYFNNWVRYLLILSLTLAGLLSGKFSSELHANTLIYTIEEGDTLEAIALRFKVTVPDLIKINRFPNLEQARKNISYGKSILIPPPDIILAAVNKEGIQPITSDLNLRSPVMSSVTSSQTQNTPKKTSSQSSPVIPQAVPTIQSSNQEIKEPSTTPSNTPTHKPAATETIYTVEKGDTLLAISRKTKISVGIIRALNQLEGDYIRPGQVLRISNHEQAVRTIAENRQGGVVSAQTAYLIEPEPNHYKVKKGDTLSSISRKFQVPISHLQKWNTIINADQLRVGTNLRLTSFNQQPQSIYQYTVEKGDTLWAIAKQFNLSVAKLKLYNPNLETILYPGQVLQVDNPPSNLIGNTVELLPPNVYEESDEKTEKTLTSTVPTAISQQTNAIQVLAVEQEAVTVESVRLPQFTEENEKAIPLSEYFTRNSPRVLRQPDASYYEEFTDDPLENYQTARRLLGQFDQKIETMPQISQELEGYSILIDPGHGGLDPGFHSQSKDGNGKPLYIIEDEYNYDYALRLYRQLKLHGAHVGLTILSPNHLIINSPDASRTLVSQKNEIYNSPFINQRGEYSSWPVGTPSGLSKRVKVAESFYNGTVKEKRIFISLHNDNSPLDTSGRLVLYYDDSLTIDKLGQRMAESLLPHLGRNAHMRGQNLAVLRKNPARYAVLVELRNIAHPRNSWAIRNASLRQEDTEMLTNGILHFVQSLKEN